jgi:DNA ligase (NAD+)
MDDVEEMLSIIRDSSYEIRTDGVVIYPLGEDILPNYNDIMDNAIAYKVNTEEALTTVDYGYVSVGRLGNAIPMLHVVPVEVNETIVTDVSLGSFDKFVSMDIHEGEQVLIYSAGNVIPQAKIPEHRHYKAGAKLLKIKKRCPYCGEKLSRYKATYKCKNEKCPRVKSGRITNFIVKLKAENVSDRTIEDLVGTGLVKDIPDIFKLTEEDIMQIPGYQIDSASLIVNEFHKIKTRPISVSSFLGALGIQGISEKKCKKMIAEIKDINSLLKKPEKLKWVLMNADDIGLKTASIFTDFVSENHKLIKTLLEEMNITNDVKYKGNVVFTGFRNQDLEKQFNDLGYEVSNNVNSNTVAVIDASYEHDSTKCKMAEKKGVDIVHISDVEKVLDGLS